MTEDVEDRTAPPAEPEAEDRPESGPMEPQETTHEHRVRLAELVGAAEGAESVLVLTHDNPDPDALASAAGLAFLLEETAGVSTEVGFGGIIGRAENRALMGEMGVKFRRLQTVEEPATTLIALADTQPRAGNNSLPPGRIASIVIDHHPLRSDTVAASFADIRPDYGASCSIVVEYLRAADLEPDRKLATALFYGVQSETMDLGREVAAADVDASLYLYPRSDPAALARIRHARVPAGYLRALHGAIEVARQHGGVILVPMGRLDYPDMVAEIADLFMHMEGVEWVVALGRYGDQLLLSLRTYDVSAHAGSIVRGVMGDRGSAGGHGMLAGGQLSVKSLSEEEVAALRERTISDLLDALGAGDEPGEPLVPLEGEEGEGSPGSRGGRGSGDAPT